MRHRWATAALAATVLTLGFAVVGVGGAAAGGSTCSGGSIAAGTYQSLVVTGMCAVDSGNVTVRGDLTVGQGALLVAAFGGSDLTVGGNLTVQKNGSLVLGCEPEAFVCFNDPDQTVGTMATSDTIAGNLNANGALAVLVHNNSIGGNVAVNGGGGGVNCDPQDVLFGSPAYATFEDNTIGGNATVQQWQSCWNGFFRNRVKGNLVFDHNVTADPDGNELATNTVGGNLNCQHNSPAPQIGDSGGAPNVVAKNANGQCAGLVAG